MGSSLTVLTITGGIVRRDCDSDCGASTLAELAFNCERVQHAVQHGVLSLRPVLQRACVIQPQSQRIGDDGDAGIARAGCALMARGPGLRR